MIARKVIARHVTNLTDARYFAAWGVEWISFDQEFVFEDGRIRPEIKEMMDWLEGVRYATEFNREPSLEELSHVEEHFEGIILDNAYVKYVKNIEAISRGESQEHACIISNMQAYRKSERQVYISSVKSVEELDKVMKLYPELGFTMSGGEEEKIGLKSFEELDDFFERMLI